MTSKSHRITFLFGQDYGLWPTLLWTVTDENFDNFSYLFSSLIFLLSLNMYYFWNIQTIYLSCRYCNLYTTTVESETSYDDLQKVYLLAITAQFPFTSVLLIFKVNNEIHKMQWKDGKYVVHTSTRTLVNHKTL